MHRIATKPGDLDSERKLEGVRQTPADILFISTADTELSGLAQVWGKRFQKKAEQTLSLMQAIPLQHPDAAEHYADHVFLKQNWRFSGCTAATVISRICWTKSSTLKVTVPKHVF